MTLREEIIDDIRARHKSRIIGATEQEAEAAKRATQDAIESINYFFDKAAAELEDKYKWHDLRDNPADLPEKGEQVEVAYFNGVWHQSYEFYKPSWYPAGFTTTQTVIAWKKTNMFKG